MRQNMTTIVKYAADPLFTTAHSKHESDVEKGKTGEVHTVDVHIISSKGSFVTLFPQKPRSLNCSHTKM